MTLKTWQERIEDPWTVTSKEVYGAMQAEIDELRAELAKECRHIKQAEGKHPAPCARFCESTAYEIELRQLKAENSKLRAALDAWEKQEPVAYVMLDFWITGKHWPDDCFMSCENPYVDAVPLYTKPKEAT